MDLKTYTTTIETGAALAARIRVPQSLISQWSSVARPVPPKRCPAIERATEGAVTRRDLRPDDWWLIWPELVTKEFPAPIANKEAA